MVVNWIIVMFSLQICRLLGNLYTCSIMCIVLSITYLFLLFCTNFTCVTIFCIQSKQLCLTLYYYDYLTVS